MSNGSTAQQMMQSGMSEAKKDLRQAGAEFKNNTARQLLEQWVKIFSGRDAGRDSTRGFSAYVAILNEAHILKTDECIKRLAMKISYNHRITVFSDLSAAVQKFVWISHLTSTT